MKNLILFIIILFAILGCKKESNSEYAQDDSHQGFNGRWKLVESRVSPGDINYIVTDKTKDNIILHFKSDGKVSSSQFTCEGDFKYYEETQDKNLYPYNLSISFPCRRNNSKVDEKEWRVRTEFKDNNTLYIYNSRCIEGCSEMYRRLK